MSEPKTFTEQQLKDWEDFEKVRQGGRWNMFDPRARKATKLSDSAYSFVLHNYSALKEQVAKENA